MIRLAAIDISLLEDKMASSGLVLHKWIPSDRVSQRIDHFRFFFFLIFRPCNAIVKCQHQCHALSCAWISTHWFQSLQNNEKITDFLPGMKVILKMGKYRSSVIRAKQPALTRSIFVAWYWIWGYAANHKLGPRRMANEYIFPPTMLINYKIMKEVHSVKRILTTLKLILLKNVKF